MSKILLTIPEPLKDFKCIGTDCVYNCCDSIWKILVDKDTYYRYQSISGNEAVACLIKKYIKPNPKSKGRNDYAYIVHNDRCPFLTEENLCIIQKSCGEEYLCHTCNSYPRIGYMIDGKAHMGFSLTCEEVVRRCILLKDGIKQVTLETECNYPFENLELTKQLFHNPRRYFFEIRQFIFAVLQFRKYPFSERMIFLGLFMKALDDCPAGSVPALIEKYLKLIASGGAEATIKALPARPELPADFISRMIILNKSELDKHVADRIDSLDSLIKSRKGDREDFFWYTELTEEYGDTLRSYEYIFENFMVMSLFNTSEILVNPSISFLDVFGQLAMYYFVLRHMFMTLWEKATLSDFDIIEVCVETAHAYDIRQTGSLSKSAKAMLSKQGANRLGFYISLINENKKS